MRYALVQRKASGPSNPKLGDVWVSPHTDKTYYFNGVHWFLK